MTSRWPALSRVILPDQFKTVEAVFVKERTQIVVITVKVYYSNEKEAST